MGVQPQLVTDALGTALESVSQPVSNGKAKPIAFFSKLPKLSTKKLLCF